MKHWLTAFFMMIMSAYSWANYIDDPEAQLFLRDMVETYDFDEAYLTHLLMAVSKDEEVLKKIAAPAEKTKTWHEYQQIFLDDARVENGVLFWLLNAETLAKVETEFGVDASIIVSIIGVETRYGKVTGSTPVFQALATLCFDYPPRADFFCEQLAYFLQLSEAQNYSPLSIQGSYAGAMGMAQFMPSSYLEDAIDYDGDGKIDLWHSSADAIGSIGNYLANRGWTRDGKYAERLPLKPTLDRFGESHFAHIDIHTLIEDESVKDDENIIKMLGQDKEKQVGSLILQGEEGEQWWITYHNFGVITRYNTSPLYAMAVIELANKISSRIERE